jgi:hypothetical protein
LYLVNTIDSKRQSCENHKGTAAIKGEWLKKRNFNKGLPPLVFVSVGMVYLKKVFGEEEITPNQYAN